MRQRRWIELLKDYDCTIRYHPGKANVVADALGRKSTSFMATLVVKQLKLLEENYDSNVMRKGQDSMILMASIQVQSDLIQQIKGGQLRDRRLICLRNEVEKGLKLNFRVLEDDLLRFRDRICVPNDSDIKNQILRDGHNSKYTMHPGSTKMYRDLQSHYWWEGMKKEIAIYVSKCLTCQQIKAEHQRPGGLLQPLDIPEWK